jgi:hypothetical protein
MIILILNEKTFMNLMVMPLSSRKLMHNARVKKIPKRLRKGAYSIMVSVEEPPRACEVIVVCFIVTSPLAYDILLFYLELIQ